MSHHMSFSWSLHRTPLQCFEVAVEADYLAGKASHLGHTQFQVLQLAGGEDQDHFRKVVSRKQVEVILPDWARKLFKPKNTITQTEHWRRVGSDGVFVVDIDVNVNAVPAKVRGVGSLVPEGISGSRFTIECTVSSRMPVFGDRLAEFVAGQVEVNMRGEGEFAVWWAHTYYPVPEPAHSGFPGSYRPIPRRWTP